MDKYINYCYNKDLIIFLFIVYLCYVFSCAFFFNIIPNEIVLEVEHINLKSLSTIGILLFSFIIILVTNKNRC